MNHLLRQGLAQRTGSLNHFLKSKHQNHPRPAQKHTYQNVISLSLSKNPQHTPHDGI